MEYPLTILFAMRNGEYGFVLILVLMEYPLTCFIGYWLLQLIMS